MDISTILIGHHAGALFLLAIVILGLIAPRLSPTAQEKLFPVEGMGGMAAILFQTVSGANLTGRMEISWAEPWVAAPVGLLGLAGVCWLISLALRSKNKGIVFARVLAVGALIALVGAYIIMVSKTELW